MILLKKYNTFFLGNFSPMTNYELMKFAKN